MSNKPIKVTYDLGKPGGDETALQFYKDNKCLGVLVGEVAEYVYSCLHQLDALLEEKRGESND